LVRLAIHFTIIGGLLLPGAWNVADFRHGWNDFLHFYAGAKLALTEDLYNPEVVIATQRATGGSPSTALRVTRPPHYYVLLFPLGLLPYQAAYALWQILNLAAVLGTIWMWPYSRIALVHVLVFWIPLWWGFFSGSDSGIVLFFIASVVRGLAANRTSQAALALAQCTIKYHFFWLAPFAVGRKVSRVAAAAVIALLLIPLLINPFWPVDYFASVISGREVISKVPVSLFRYGGWYVLPLAGVAVVVILRTVRAPDRRFLGALAAGVLVSPHCYLQDYTAVSLLAAIALERLSIKTLKQHSMLGRAATPEGHPLAG
jgi:hypothetical protein